MAQTDSSQTSSGQKGFGATLPPKKLPCPICQDAFAVQVLAKSEIHVTQASEKKKVGVAFSAFRCDRAGHIFFVRTDDLARTSLGCSNLPLEQ
jgi:hypothetical protein